MAEPSFSTPNPEILDGAAVALAIRMAVADGVRTFISEHGRPPGLGTLLVGDDPASATYVRMKHRVCSDLGMASFDRTLPSYASQEQVEQATCELVADARVDGVLVQLPLPDGLDPNAVILAVPPEKDVDGYHPFNLGAIASTFDSVASCTPQGVMTLLDAYNVPLVGANAVVVGRSRTVGLPMALMLLERDATVTVTHHLTQDLAEHTSRADVLVSATGVPGLITRPMVKSGAVVVDIGTSHTAEGLRGDVAPDVREVASLVSPVPGGVGPMTIATLMQTTLRLAQARVTA